MAEITLTEAGRQYLAQLPDDERIASQAEVERFVRWSGADRTFDQVRGQDVANYAENLAGNVTDASNRADVVRRFLAYCKKAGFTETNMGSHLRVRKTMSTGSKKFVAAPKVVQLSETERVLLAAELESLKAQRPRIVQDIQRAMADKDFRENAPLDAAKQQQSFVEGRIQRLEATLAHAIIVEEGGVRSTEAVDIGSTVVLSNLKSGAETIYTLVRPGEVNAAAGRISYESPVGQALLAKRAGDEVEVTVPSGTIRFRIERLS